MKNLPLIFLLISLILLGLSACQPQPESVSPPPVEMPSIPTATSFPTPAASFNEAQLADRLALLEQTQPQAGAVASNRVEALIQIHNFAEAYTTALEDNTIPTDELATLLQLAANARASLYATGQPDMIQVANTAGWLLDLAIYGDWETAESSIWQFQRSLPRKPGL